MEIQTKIVYFDKFCADCAHYDKAETEEPCCDCLNVAAREYSHTPENFEKQLHFVKVPKNHIVVDLDLKDETSNKSYKLKK